MVIFVLFTFQLNYLRGLRHRHEVRSVVVSDNANGRSEKNGSLTNLQPSNNNNNGSGSGSGSGSYINNYYKPSNNITSNNTTTTNLSNNTNLTAPNNLGPVGKYLELIHSP